MGNKILFLFQCDTQLDLVFCSHAVYRCLMPAENSMALGALPVGLTQGGLAPQRGGEEVVRWSDVTIDESQEPARLRRDLEGAPEWEK